MLLGTVVLLGTGELLGVEDEPTNVFAFDAVTGELGRRFALPTSSGGAVHASPDNTLLALMPYKNFVPTLVVVDARVWNVASGKVQRELAGHTGTNWSLA